MKQVFIRFWNGAHSLKFSTAILVGLLLATSCSPANPTPGEMISPPAAGETVRSENLTPEEAVSPAPTTAGDGEHMTPQMDPPSNPAIDDLIDKAVQDLSERLGIEPDEITLVEAREVVWSNASLGCPQPGMAYADVLTSGYLIILNANNFEFEYHAGKKSEVFYCQNPEPPVSGAPYDR